MSRYDDIIHMPHYEPKHERMPIENRAAQFAPFAALTGHGAAIAETARLTEKMTELSEEEKHEISRKLSYALENKSRISIKFFLPDPLKDGGSYREAVGVIKKFNLMERVIKMSDNTSVPLDNVTDIKGDLYDHTVISKKYE